MENKSPEAITADKCVVKTILKPGQGRAPSLHARCLGKTLAREGEDGEKAVGGDQGKTSASLLACSALCWEGRTERQRFHGH